MESKQASPCDGVKGVPSAPEAAGDGEHYRGLTCLIVEVDMVGVRRDACAGTLDLRVQDGVLQGIGVCRYVGLPGERGLAELLPGDQSADVWGQRAGQSWDGDITVHTDLGVFTWAWDGHWEGAGTVISGDVLGESTVGLGGQTYTIEGQGSFEAWSID